MARMARLVVPNYPHHVTQRGNRRQKTFFSDSDYRAYIQLLAKARLRADVDVWAYCLMPNHVHFVVVPRQKDSLAVLFRDAHRQYTRRINLREGWRGHLWQERFHSSVMDERHLMAAVRYVELNPVRADLCSQPQDWPWSSVHSHLRGTDDSLVSVRPMLGRVSNWRSYLEDSNTLDVEDLIRMHARTGRPMGKRSFVQQLETITGRCLSRKMPGPAKVR